MNSSLIITVITVTISFFVLCWLPCPATTTQVGGGKTCNAAIDRLFLNFCAPRRGLWDEGGQAFALSRLMHVYGQRYRREVRKELRQSALYKDSGDSPPTTSVPRSLDGKWAWEVLRHICRSESGGGGGTAHRSSHRFFKSAEQITEEWRAQGRSFTSAEWHLPLADYVTIPEDAVGCLVKFRQENQVSLLAVIAALLGKHDAGSGATDSMVGTGQNWAGVAGEYTKVRLLVWLAVIEPIQRMLDSVEIYVDGEISSLAASTLPTSVTSGPPAPPAPPSSSSVSSPPPKELKTLLIQVLRLEPTFRGEVKTKGTEVMAHKVTVFAGQLNLADELKGVTSEDLFSFSAGGEQAEAELRQELLARKTRILPSFQVVHPRGRYLRTPQLEPVEPYLRALVEHVLGTGSRTSPTENTPITEKQRTYLRLCLVLVIHALEPDEAKRASQQEQLLRQQQQQQNLATASSSYSNPPSHCLDASQKMTRRVLAWLRRHKLLTGALSIAGPLYYFYGNNLTSFLAGRLWNRSSSSSHSYSFIDPNTQFPPDDIEGLGMSTGAMITLGVVFSLIGLAAAYYYRYILLSDDSESELEDHSDNGGEPQKTKLEPRGGGGGGGGKKLASSIVNKEGTTEVDVKKERMKFDGGGKRKLRQRLKSSIAATAMASPNVSPVETATTPATTPSPPKNQQMKKKKKKGSPIKVSAAAAVPWGRKASSPSSLPQTPPPPRSPPKSSAESPPASVLSSTSSVAAERERGKRGGVRNILPRSSGVQQQQQQLPQSRLQPSGVDFGGDAEAKMVVVLMKGGGKSQAVMGPKRRRGRPVQSATVNGTNNSGNTGGGSVFGSTTPAALTSAFPDYQQQQQRKKKADRGR